MAEFELANDILYHALTGQILYFSERDYIIMWLN